MKAFHDLTTQASNITPKSIFEQRCPLIQLAAVGGNGFDIGALVFMQGICE